VSGIKLLIVIKALCWIALGVATAAWSSQARAQGRFLDVSLSGSYQKSIAEDRDSYRRSWGLDLGLPLTSFFGIRFGHTFIEDVVVFNEKYRESALDKGFELPAGRLKAQSRVFDYSVNGDLGFNLGAVRPSLFGGALRRKICREDYYEDHGCEQVDLTWNAGAALQVYITMTMRLKASYRLSPSIAKNRERKAYDELTSVGIEWSL
jgi:hypothetical protein